MIKSKNRGFTLIELLVVISIISLLSSIILASLSEARVKAKDSALAQNLRQLNLAIQLYMEDNGTPPGLQPGFTCGGNPSAGYCKLSETSAVFNDIVPSYISSIDFTLDFDWSVPDDAKPLYIFDTYQFEQDIWNGATCGGIPFNQYEYLILFPISDASVSFNLPFNETGYIMVDASSGYHYCLGV